ncbi:MAG: DUF2610 domain-containing protein [Xanthobacteraceae bacterium]
MPRLSLLIITLAAIVVGALWAPAPATAADTRRAFLVGMRRYDDGYLSKLNLSLNDANDLARDLEEVGFDRKNIKVANDLRNKEAFDKEFNAFLKTVEPGDTVLFFFSGHGFGVETDQTNYLLLGDLKSPFTYTKAQLPEADRGKRSDAAIVQLGIAAQLDAYQKNEIPRAGVSATDIEKRLAERQPKTVIMILDACRSLVSADANDANDPARLKRIDASGSRLVSNEPLPGFMLLYSASFGEQAVESFPGEARRNSLFTEVLRSEVQRPGQSLVELGERVRLVVRAIAQGKGRQQEPEFVYDKANASRVEDFLFVGSIGAERFQLSQDKCAGDQQDWDRIKNLQKRELYDRHRRRFDGCGTAELARRALSQLALTADDPIEVPVAVVERKINDCDRWAASEFDQRRPPDVPGVPFDDMDVDKAIPACEKAIADNPRVPRYLFNLARAYQKQAAEPSLDEDKRIKVLRKARLIYEDATKSGYISALNNLAVLIENLEGVEQSGEETANLLKKAAQQGHPLAMYNLALRYYNGTYPIKRDFREATQWFGKSAEKGFVSAMVEYGLRLRCGCGLDHADPRRAVEWLQRAADAGSTRAKLELGRLYLRDNTGINTVRQDLGLALLWFGRAAETGDSEAYYYLAQMIEYGLGVPSQPEIAERYWRLAANGGNSNAQVEFAQRLREGLVLVKQEYGEGEIITLLSRAMAQGSASAALGLAQIYRAGEFGEQKNPLEAMKLAYRAIRLSTQSDPTTAEGNPFYEIAAGHLLAEMAKNGEAVDAAGRPMLSVAEIDRLERSYGAVDPVTKQVKIRRLDVYIANCGWPPRKEIWVWDWGRAESPTEAQFRSLERSAGCTETDVVRRTLIDVFEQAKKNKVAFADLIFERIKTAQAAKSADEPRRRRR